MKKPEKTLISYGSKKNLESKFCDQKLKFVGIVPLSSMKVRSFHDVERSELNSWRLRLWIVVEAFWDLTFSNKWSTHDLLNLKLNCADSIFWNIDIEVFDQLSNIEVARTELPIKNDNSVSREINLSFPKRMTIRSAADCSIIVRLWGNGSWCCSGRSWHQPWPGLHEWTEYFAAVLC